MKSTSLLLLLFLLGVVTVRAASFDDCVGCHQRLTPAAVSQWQNSRHATAKVSCQACHGDDHGRMVTGKARVDSVVYGTCHGEILQQHANSRHGIALHAA